MTGERLIVFDCDGTLVDSQHLIVACMESAFAGEGVHWPGRAATLAIVGLSIPQAMLQLAPDATAVTHRRLGEGYRQAFFELRADPDNAEPLYPGVLATIQKLAADPDVVLGIATGKSQRGVRHLLERENLTKAFVTIQTADDAPSKPHPEMLFRAMSDTGIEPGKTVMVGDTVFDIEMAGAAKAHGLGVAWGYHHVDDLRQAGAGLIAERFEQVPELALALIEGTE